MQTPKGEINDKVMELVKDEEVLAKMAATGSAQECYDLVKDRICIGFEDFQTSLTVATPISTNRQMASSVRRILTALQGGKANIFTQLKLFSNPTVIRVGNDPSLLLSSAVAAGLK